MKITEDVREYARKTGLPETEAVRRGLAEKSREFLEHGAEIYR